MENNTENGERTTPQLRPHQAMIAATLADSLESGRRQTEITMPSGQGRTMTAAATAAEVARRMPSEVVVVAVAQTEMLVATARMVRDLGDAGLVVTTHQPGAKPHGNVVVALTADVGDLLNQSDEDPIVIFAGGRERPGTARPPDDRASQSGEDAG